MLLSVIIPYYNADAWIGKMLDSLLDQDIDASDYEIIVVDDASEREPVVLMEYVNRYSHIHYHRIPHGGMALARNHGMSVATGEWIYFCDSDDFVQPQVLGGILQAARERDLEMIVAGHVTLFHENGPVPTPHRNFDKVTATMTGWEYFSNPPDNYSWGVWAYLVKRSALESNGLVFDNIYYVEDRLFKLKLLDKISRVAFIDVDLYYYVQHEVSVYHSKRWENGPDYVETLFFYLNRLTDYIQNPSTPAEAHKMLEYRRKRGVYVLLLNAFVYCPFEVNRSSIDRLKSMGLYPVAFERSVGTPRLRAIKWLMDHPRLWLLSHRIVHLLPQDFLRSHFKVNK